MAQLLMGCVEHKGSMEPVCFVGYIHFFITIQTYITDEKGLILYHVINKYLQKLVRPKEFNFFVN